MKEPRNDAIAKFILRRAAIKWSGVRDPRRRHGRRWQLASVLNALLLGMVAQCRALLDVESMTAKLSVSMRRSFKATSSEMT